MLERYIAQIESAKSNAELMRIAKNAWRSVSVTDMDMEIIRALIHEKYCILYPNAKTL